MGSDWSTKRPKKKAKAVGMEILSKFKSIYEL